MTGNIEVITGPMKSGKTEELIRRINKYEAANKKIIVFKPSIDTRTDYEIVSRNGFSIPAMSIDLGVFLAEELSEMNDVVCFDEAQFFHAELINCVQKIADKNKKVIVSGLDMDYLREPFGYIPEIMAIADNIVKLTSICDICKNDNAIYTKRIIKADGIIIGDKNIYEARCRGCFE